MTHEPDGRPDDAPEQALEPESSLPETSVQDLPDLLREAVARMGWTSLMPVQAKAIPYLLARRDLMVQSRTGTGKTGAFILPIMAHVDPHSPRCQALVLVPTRELARQVLGEAQALAAGTGIRSVALYGGVGYGPQLDALRRGAHLVVATPGRILDHLMRRTLALDGLEILVFDEADRMLSVGFYPDIKALAAYLPASRCGFMFSATYPPSVRTMARQFLRDPESLSLSHGGEHVVETEHVYYEVPAMEKDRCLVRIIEVENPESAIVFTNTKATANYVSVVLQRFGYDADQLSSDLSQNLREKVLARVYKKKLRFLVATDVAARGIDIENLSHVILYDFPEDPESYIHRTGRTGRAGASGEAISLVDVLEKMRLKAVVRQYGVDMEHRELPTDEDVQAVVSERVIALLEARLRNLDRLVQERMQRMLPLARKLGDNDDELAVIAMLLDAYYQNTLHAPPDAPEDTGRRESGRRPEGGRRKPRRGKRRSRH
ncbi:MAG: DEAD/DEAH box helicase [Candidatus Krumholzibacteriia bacterium]